MMIHYPEINPKLNRFIPVDFHFYELASIPLSKQLIVYCLLHMHEEEQNAILR